jgi:undecaprenyl-phosphate 4-deoxy-4-formamido-L-arabinose transferase
MQDKISNSISLVVPVYNERDLLFPAVEHCMKVISSDFEDFELILVDDGSTDGTGEAMDKLAVSDSRICVLRNNINLNVGISVQRAMTVASKEYVVHNAIDFPLAAEDIAGLVSHMEDCDVLVLERKSYAGYTAWRWITSKINRVLLRVMFGATDISDLNFTQMYRAEVIPTILPLAKSPSFTTPEMILRAWRIGLRVKSVEVDYKPRIFGKGSFGRPHDMIWSLYDMIRFRLKEWGKLKTPVKEN